MTLKEDNIQRFPIVLYFILVVLAGQAADHPLALLRAYSFLKWLSVPIFCILFLYILLYKKNVDFHGINFLTVLIVFYVFFSAFINNRFSFTTILGWLGLYLKYVLFFVYLINIPLSLSAAKNFLKWILWFGVILVIEGFIRYFSGLGYSDTISFILGPNGTLTIAYVCLTGIAYTSSIALVKHRPSYFLIALFLALISMPGEIKALAIGAPIIIAMTYVFYRKAIGKLSTANLIYGSLSGVIIVFAMLYIWSHFFSAESDQASNFFNNLISLITSGGDITNYNLNRFSDLAMVIEFLKRSNLFLFFGYGPGSSFAGAFTGHEGIFLQKFVYIQWNQLAAIIVDIGLVGLIIIFILLLSYTRIVKPFFKNFIQYDQEMQILILTTKSVSFIFLILGPFHDLIWRYDFIAYIYFLLISSLYVYSKKNLSQSKVNA